MTFSRVDFIAQQLQAAAPDAEWDAAGVDRAPELARILERNGIIDLARLRLVKVVVSYKEFEWSYPVDTLSLALEYEGRYFGFLGGPNEPENRISLHKTDKGYEVAWSAEGHGHVGYVIEPMPAGFAIVPVWGSSSDADKIRQAVISIASIVVMFVLPAAGIAAGAAIGSAVVPASFAASYPGLTAAIGNVAISAAFTGGDIEGAVKGAVISYFSGFVGAQAAGITNIDGIGKVAAAATRAYIQGGDVQKAVGTALLSQGASIVSDLYSTYTADPFALDYTVDFTGDDLNYGTGDWLTLPSVSDPFAWQWDSPDIFGGDDWWNLPSDSWDNWTLSPPPMADIPIPDVPGYTTSPPPATTSDWSLQNILVNTTAVVNTALQLQAAYLKLQNLSVNQTAQASQPNGTITRQMDDGRIATRHPDGSVTYSLPPVGVAAATVSGSFVTNNGDGTYTLISGDGSRTTRRYGASTGGGSMNMGMLAALGVGAFLLLKGK